MAIREELHEALDVPDFPSATLLTRSVAALKTPRPQRRHARLASLIAGFTAFALILTFIAVRLNASPPTLPALPTATTISNLIDYDFVSPRVGFVELRTTAIIFAATSDGGSTWHRILVLRSQTSMPVMQWLDSRTGIVVDQEGHPAVVRRTTDGGLHWQAHSVPVPQDAPLFGAAVAEGAALEAAHFLNSVQGWIVYRYQGNCGGCGFSAERFVYTTIDGGLHWSEVGVSTLGPAQRQLTFFTESWGVLNSPSAFLELDVTQDGGRTWHQSVIPAPAGGCKAMCEINGRESHAFFSGDRGVLAISWCLGDVDSAAGNACYLTFPFKPTESHLYQTTDGGVTWSYVRDLPLTTGSISFINAEEAVMVGSEGVIWTSDAGATWSSPYPSPVPSGWYVQRTDFADKHHGLLALTTSGRNASTGIVSSVDQFELLATSDAGASWRLVNLPKA